MQPSVWLGAAAPGGLGLPDAMPTPSQLYAPRGVWLDDRRLIVCDTGNHRVMIWPSALDRRLDSRPLDSRPLDSHSDAAVVLGQPDFMTEGAQAGGLGPANGMRLPTGVIVHEERLVVADAWNHRLLIWDEVPEESSRPPDHIVGQCSPFGIEENRGGACGPLGMYWPFGLAMVDGQFYVADTGNRRVLVWDGIPDAATEPVLIAGQPDAFAREENRGGIAPDSFRWPHDVAGTADRLFVADAGNHRVLGWGASVSVDAAADQVLGQTDFVSGGEFPYAPQTATALRFPYAISIDPEPAGGPAMAVADTANNRILLWDEIPSGSTAPADHVLGQPDFASNGENRWDQVLDDTLCWPYGLCLHRGRLAIADSGNNRVMIWQVGP